MASFLSLYRHEYDTVNAGDGLDYLSSLDVHRRNVREWKTHPDKFHDFVASTETSPLVIALPANGARVALIYCTAMDDDGDQLLGIKGFSPFSKCSINPADIVNNLVSDGVAKKIKALPIPKISQLFQADSASSLTKIKGEDKRNVESFGKLCPASMLWPSIFLPAIVDEKVTIPANELLFTIIAELKGLRKRAKNDDAEKGTKWWKSVVAMWSDHLRYLWVIAKGGAAPITMKQSFNRKKSKGFERLLRLKWELADTLMEETESSDSKKEPTSKATDADSPLTTPTQTAPGPAPGVASLTRTEVEPMDNVVTEEDIKSASTAAIMEGWRQGTQHLQTVVEEPTQISGEDEDRKPAAKGSSKKRPPRPSHNGDPHPTTPRGDIGSNSPPRNTATRSNPIDAPHYSSTSTKVAHRGSQPVNAADSFSLPDSEDFNRDDDLDDNEEGSDDEEQAEERDADDDSNKQPEHNQTGRSNAGGGGGGDDDGSDGSSDGYFSGGDDDAEMAKLRKTKRRRLEVLRRGKEADRSRVMAEVAVENQFLEQQKRISESQRKSATSGWTESHRRLVNMLSLPADGRFPRKIPTWTKFAKSFFRDKSIQTSLNIMTQATKRSWPGSMLRSGMVTLVSQGFVAPEQRRERMGFSVFHFAPPNFKEETTQKEKEQQIRDGHSSSDLNDELVKEYARQKYFLPFRLDEAQNMLEVGIKVLELLCGPGSIALLPYQKGLELLYSRHHDVYWAIENDKHYLVKFLFFLDGVFQNLVQTLLRCLEFPSPTAQAAARRVHMLPGQQIEDVMRDFLTNNIQVNLPAPTALVAKLGAQSVEGGRMITMGQSNKKEQSGGDRTTTPKKKSQDEKKPEKWHRENPSPVAAWEFPTDTPTMTFFPREGRFNNKFPRFAHHISNRLAPMCLKYQTSGECYKGDQCGLAHIVPDKMPSDKRAKVDAIMAEQKRVAVENKLME